MPGNQSKGPPYRRAKREFHQFLRHGKQCNGKDPHSTPFVPFAAGTGLAIGMGEETRIRLTSPPESAIILRLEYRTIGR